MLRYIQESPLSKVFYLEDFAQCGSYTSIRSEIVRLEQKHSCKIDKGIIYE